MSSTRSGPPNAYTRAQADADEAASPSGLRGEMGVIGVLMQAIAHMAPATGIAFSAAAIFAVTLVAAPVSIAIAGVIVLMLGICLTQLAKHLPSAGGYFTYVSRGVGPRAGFFTSWLYFLYDPLLIGAVWMFAGKITESALASEYGITVPWWAITLVGVAAVTVLSFRGMSVSARAVVVVGILEVVIIAALAIHGLLSPGPGGFSWAPFDPGNAPSLTALYLGVVFGVFLYTGFETVTPLAEETRNPRRTLPLAIVISILITVVVYVFCSWGVMIGWGIDDIDGLAGDGSPLFTLAARLWDGAWLLVLLAVFNSVIALSIAAQNASTRVFYAMARVGALPRPLARIHPRFHTPVGGIALQTVITLIVCVAGGLLLGPLDTLVVVGLAVVLVMALVYSIGNLAVWRLYRREHRAEFNPVLHAMLPALSSAALLWVAYKSVYPLPEGSAGWAPLAVLLWIISGVVVTWYLGRPARRQWMEQAGQVMSE